MTEAQPTSHMAYRVLTASRVPRMMRRLSRGAVVFCFHNVLPRDHTGLGDASLHMSGEHFETVVRWISEAYQIVGLAELASRVRAGRSVRGLAVLTFDDAYVGSIGYGLVVLKQLNLPATLFVVSRAAEQPSVFWWDRLASLGELSEKARREHLYRHRGASVEILRTVAALSDQNLPTLPDTLMPESWTGIRSALDGNELLEIGSHTVTHPNLTALTPSELAEELERSRGEIDDALGTEVNAVSYPYGLHNERVIGAASRAGYGTGVTLGPGLVRTGRNPLAIPRLNVPATIGLEALECWALGLHPH